MDFTFNDTQTMLADSVSRFVSDHYSLEQRQALAGKEPGFSNDHWQTMAELGWFALPVPEADGGIGGGPVDTMVVMEQFGRGLVLEPFLAHTVLGTTALLAAGSTAQKDALLPGVVDGSHQLAFAYQEEQSRYDLQDVVTSARQDGDSWVLNGSKHYVKNAATAASIIVLARSSGGQQDRDGLSLYLVPADADGVTVHSYPTVDGLRAAELVLNDVRLPADALLGAAGSASPVLEQVVQAGTLAVCAEAVGAMEVLYKDTVAYTQDREQFGHALAQFQSLQHRMVDMFMEYEQARSLLFRATMEQAQGAASAARTIHALKHLVGKASTFIAENAVQLHGGMGVTEELRVGHYFKRLTVIELEFGNTDFHLEQFVA